MRISDLSAAAQALARFERSLDPAHPERAGARMLAYGEISAALLLDEIPSLRGLVVKRMSGFADDRAANEYLMLLREYLDRLNALGIATVATEAVRVDIARRRPVVYLLQEKLPADALGHRLLHHASDDELARATTTVLDQTLKVFAANAAQRADQISLDAQLSNWCFWPNPDWPVLVDVGTPFIRRGGRHAFDQENLLSAVPPGIRNYYRWKGTAAEYMDDYFEPRLIAVDLLGNFHKEKAAQRLPVALAAANAWLHGPAAEMQRQLAGPRSTPGPITAAEVAQYYEQDAATLELFLRVRRLDRAVRRVTRSRYDFILPGKVQR